MARLPDSDNMKDPQIEDPRWCESLKGEIDQNIKYMPSSEYKQNDHRSSSDTSDLENGTKSLRKLFIRFAEKTSMQGIPYINSAKFWWSRALWTILTLGAVAAMTLHLYYLFDQYYKWPIQTKISLGFENQQLPAITICNFNTFKKYKLAELPAGHEAFVRFVEYLSPKNVAPDYYEIYDDFKKQRKKRFIDEMSSFNISAYDDDYYNYDDEYYYQDYDGMGTSINELAYFKEIGRQLYMDIPRDLRAEYGHNISDMLRSCSFNGRNCYPENFTLFQTPEYGNCWTLDSRKLVVRSSGPDGGLSVILFLENYEFLEGITTGTGVRVAIHEHGTLPFPFAQGQFVSSATETDMGLRKVQIKREDTPYGNCTDGQSFESKYKTKYTRTVCNKMCTIKKLFEECNCFNLADQEFVLKHKNYANSRPCEDFGDGDKCSTNFHSKVRQKKVSCPECENPCSESLYVKSISSRHWPSENYASVLLEDVCQDRGICEELLKLNSSFLLGQYFLKLNIYYEDLNFEIVEETPEIQPEQFLSDVGGAVGLWIGLSILAFCEILQLGVELMGFIAHKCCNEKQRSTQTSSRQKSQSNNAGMAYTKGSRSYIERTTSY